jgi:hypothetical protein
MEELSTVAYNDLVKFFKINPDLEGIDVEVVPPDEKFEYSNTDGYVVFKYNNNIYVQEYDEVYETSMYIATYSVCIINDRGDGMVFITDIKAK